MTESVRAHACTHGRTGQLSCVVRTIMARTACITSTSPTALAYTTRNGSLHAATLAYTIAY